MANDQPVYTDLDKSLELLITLQTVADYYKIAKHEEQLRQWLIDTRGVFPPDEKNPEAGQEYFYRYYLVAAIFIETNQEVNILKRAEGGTEFTNFDRTAQTYRNLQWRIDGASGAIISESLKLTYCEPCDNPVNLQSSSYRAGLPCGPIGSRVVRVRKVGYF
ncbi:MAG: hypothetical protein F6J98_01705 [Moorea sp. SIO4G2]|nr:hypothetical protein [Moorena sp. SIO4G2]